MKRENVDALFGDGLAEFSKRSRSVFQANCELPVDWHDVNLTFDLLGDEPGTPARGNKQKYYASVRLITRFRVASLSAGHPSATHRNTKSNEVKVIQRDDVAQFFSDRFLRAVAVSDRLSRLQQ